MVSRMLIVAAIALVVVVAPAVNADKRVDVGGGFYVDVKGQSGKIAVGTTGNTTSRVVVEFDSMTERDASGDEVGSGSSTVTHGFNSFASQDFTFSATQQVVYLGVAAVNFNFTANLQTSAVLTVQTYLFKEAGTVDIGVNETMDVKRGTLKFNIQIRDWVFCDSTATSGQPGYCKKGSTMETGKWLDLAIEVKGKSDTKAGKLSKKQKGNKHVPNEYTLGDGAVFGASTQVNNNGVWVPMADGYPLEAGKGKKTLFTFRFPKFDNPGYVYYDPSITLDATNGAVKYAVSLVMMAFVAALTMFGVSSA